MSAEKRHSVLVVDDEPPFLVTVAGILADDFDVVTCGTAEEALRLATPERFHVVCCDYRLPGMNGLEFLDRIAARHPQVCCLLLTGATDYYATTKSTEKRPPVLFKPFPPATFLRMVAHLARLAEMKRGAHVMADSVGQLAAAKQRGSS